MSKFKLGEVILVKKKNIKGVIKKVESTPGGFLGAHYIYTVIDVSGEIITKQILDTGLEKLPNNDIERKIFNAKQTVNFLESRLEDIENLQIEVTVMYK